MQLSHHIHSMHHTKSVTTNIKSVNTRNNYTVTLYHSRLQYQTSLYIIIYNYIMTYVRISILQQLITQHNTIIISGHNQTG